MTQSSLRGLLEALEGHPISDEVYQDLMTKLSQLKDDPESLKSIQLVSLEGLFRVYCGVLKVYTVNA